MHQKTKMYFYFSIKIFLFHMNQKKYFLIQKNKMERGLKDNTNLNLQSYVQIVV